MPSDEPTLEELSFQIEAQARVLGLILLLMAGHAFPRSMIEDIAEACGVSPVDPEPLERAH